MFCFFRNAAISCQLLNDESFSRLALVYICVFENKSAHYGFLEIGCYVFVLLGNEYVGGYAALGVDCAAGFGVVFLAVFLYAVSRFQFAAVHAVEDVHVVLFLLAGNVRFLYATARRHVISRNCEAQHAAVAEFYGLLHQSLAECAPSYDSGAVVILHGTRENLTGRRAFLIYKYY